MDIACTLHPGLVSISFYAIPICPSTIDNILIYLCTYIVYCSLVYHREDRDGKGGGKEDRDTTLGHMHSRPSSPTVALLHMY